MLLNYLPILIFLIVAAALAAVLLVLGTGLGRYFARFHGDRATTGGEYWRTDEFFTSCDCWRVIDPSFHPSFN